MFVKVIHMLISLCLSPGIGRRRKVVLNIAGDSYSRSLETDQGPHENISHYLCTTRTCKCVKLSKHVYVTFKWSYMYICI